MHCNNNIATVVALLSAVAGVSARPAELLVKRAPSPPRALQESAPADHIKFQPVFDYDTDSCYNVPAIDAQGNVCEGLSTEFTSNTKDCRDASDLDNQNVYSRRRCNHGWCAYMYEHYFEKDVALQYWTGTFSGHRHEWENVVVWVKDGDDKPTYVSASQHDGYETKDARDVRFQGSNAKIVYHKDGLGSHALRFANAEDDNPVENDKHEWIRGALVGWTSWPSTSLRDQMIQAFNGGGIRCKLADDLLGGYLKKSIGDRIPEFDVNSDA
ncbi:hypothetical protein K4F52_000383 [Lecanicillium sp. MT-2017a]|nr:hypothetical protein K4F52_000383 [Lecanicillium sp. MT-2017a]